jgi:hypothetical protein
MLFFVWTYVVLERATSDDNFSQAYGVNYQQIIYVRRPLKLIFAIQSEASFLLSLAYITDLRSLSTPTHRIRNVGFDSSLMRMIAPEGSSLFKIVSTL